MENVSSKQNEIKGVQLIGTYNKTIQKDFSDGYTVFYFLLRHRLQDRHTVQTSHPVSLFLDHGRHCCGLPSDKLFPVFLSFCTSLITYSLR